MTFRKVCCFTYFVSTPPSQMARRVGVISQKRRVAIAGIMAIEPEVLVLDEPAAGLDPRGKKHILNGIKEYQEKTASSVVIVSHSMEDMASLCDELIVMSGAHVVMQGSCSDVFCRAQELKDIGLDIPQITKLMVAVRDKGFDVNPGVFTVGDAHNELMKLLK